MEPVGDFPFDSRMGLAGRSAAASAAIAVPAARADADLLALRPPAIALASSLRPRQWTKNVLVFAGVIFAAKFTDLSRWLATGEVFFAYCAASSAAYLLNDIFDVERDRLHPKKRLRPIANGTISMSTARLTSAALMAAALAAAAAAGRDSLLALLAFLALQASYTLRLKHVVLIDVLVIAALFVLRATAGAIAAAVKISPWLLLCTGLLALFLALSKRRAELASANGDKATRPALGDYSIQLLDQLLLIAATSTITSYALYTFTARDSKALMVTIPFVVFGLFRYLLLADRDGLGEQPENVVLTDIPLLICIASWVGTAAVVLGVA